MTDAFEILRVERADGVAAVTIDHPPLNLMDQPMLRELNQLHAALADDDDVRVIVFRSADPDFFIAHADVLLIKGMGRRITVSTEELTGAHKTMERWRTIPKVTIAQLDGQARGGGSEFALSLDMRFAAAGRTVLGQPEVALGIIPGGSGTERLARLMGRSRALEVVLGCEDFPAELAERYGWVNRVLPPEQLGPFVDGLAARIASFPLPAIRAAKAAVLGAVPDATEALIGEAQRFAEARADPEVDRRIDRALELGAQTRDIERRLGTILEELA